MTTESKVNWAEFEEELRKILGPERAEAFIAEPEHVLVQLQEDPDLAGQVMSLADRYQDKVDTHSKAWKKIGLFALFASAAWAIWRARQHFQVKENSEE